MKANTDTVQADLGQRLIEALRRFDQEDGNGLKTLLTKKGQVRKATRVALGNDLIELLCKFTKKDISDSEEWEIFEFNYIRGGPRDDKLRRTLSRTLFGARWLYKLGLLTLVAAGSDEREAHVRAQIYDYAGVIESLLRYCNIRAIDNGYAQGDDYKWLVRRGRQPIEIAWVPGKAGATMDRERLNFCWQTRTARQFGIISDTTEENVHVLRQQRNKVHIEWRLKFGEQAYLSQSRRAYDTFLQVHEQCREFCAANLPLPRPAPRTTRPGNNGSGRRGRFLRRNTRS